MLQTPSTIQARARLCREPRDWMGNLNNLLAHVVSLNLHRRHLNESQKAMVAARLANISHGGDRRSDQAANLQFGPGINSLTVQDVADQLTVSPRTVETARKVLKLGAPEVIDAVDRDVVTVSDAASIVERPTQAQTALLREVLGGSTKKLKIAARQHDVARQRRDIEQGNLKLPTGVFEIISIDPPWPYGDQDSYDPANWSSRLSTPYPEMSLEELAALEIPAAPDCVLWSLV